MMSNHTPGPWRIGAPKRVLGCDTRGQLYIHGKDVTIAAMLDGDKAANAKLIAAAPELLHSLSELHSLIVDMGWANPHSNVYQSVIKAKALLAKVNA